MKHGGCLVERTVHMLRKTRNPQMGALNALGPSVRRTLIDNSLLRTFEAILGKN